MSLYITATPIGNLEDITLRAVRVLNEADIVACENLPRTKALLSHLNIKQKRLIEYSPANEKNSAKGLVALMEAGQSVALVSDAGTPCISDPGLSLVQAALDAGISVVPVPGPSALTALASVCGMAGEALVFLGFLPKKEGPALKILQRYGTEGAVLILYESGRRLKKLLEMLQLCSVSSDIAVGKELTKIHEAVLRGSPQELLLQITESQKGEYVLALRFHGGVILPQKEKPFSKKEKRQQKLQKRIDTGEVTYGS